MIVRSLLAVLLAGVVIAVLQWRLAAPERQRTENRDSVEFLAAPAAPPTWPAAIPSGEAWLLYLLAPTDALPPSARPAVAIGATGELRLLRAPPAPDGPDLTEWLAAAVVLPSHSLAALSARSRAALLEVLYRWRGASALGLADRVVVGHGLDARGLAELLRFAR
ncbi:MAG: hypothetical protein AB7I19_16650 [Planctomycetota bacterium]